MAGEGQFVGGGEPLSLVTPTGTRAYRGALRSVVPQQEASDGPSDRDTVNVLTMQAYLRGVVPLEMPASWSPAAVQAQSVAARTYAAWSRAFPRRTHYDICDTTSCQVYGGVAAEHPLSDAAVEATDKQVLLRDGAPAFTQFSASSGGWTAAGSVPYLVAQEDPYDGWSGNAVHDWKVAFTDRDLEKRYPRLGDLRRITVVTRDGAGDWGGRVGTLRLVGSKGTVTVSGDSARWTLGLRSTYVTFRVREASASRSARSTLRQVSPATSFFDQPRASTSAINPG
jgi:SpoIID/LytB domain protein